MEEERRGFLQANLLESSFMANGVWSYQQPSESSRKNGIDRATESEVSRERSIVPTLAVAETLCEDLDEGRLLT